jgi:predicted acyltransferase
VCSSEAMIRHPGVHRASWLVARLGLVLLFSEWQWALSVPIGESYEERVGPWRLVIVGYQGRLLEDWACRGMGILGMLRHQAVSQQS